MEIPEKVILTPKDISPTVKGWKVESIINPGGIRLPNKKIMLYARVAEKPELHKGKMIHCPVIVSKDEYKVASEKIEKNKISKKRRGVMYLKNGTCRLTTFSHFKKIILNETGDKVESIQQKPAFTGMPKDGNYGVEDPRIIKFKNNYLMTYVTISSREGVCTSLAISKDLINWKRKGIIFREQNKDVVLFPEKIKGKFVALHRPMGTFHFSKPSIWISHSPDLIYWGNEHAITMPRENAWDSEKIGPGAPPIKTKKGWLVIYHGVKNTKRKETEKRVYSAGALLLNLKNPQEVLARSPIKKPLFKPEESHEKKGFVDNVVFPTTAIPTLDKKDLLIYSGEADSLISVRKIPINMILRSMEYY